jgi:hypothetical protein
VNAYWLSWYHHPDDGEFELHTPWWVSGFTMSEPQRDTIVAAVQAANEETAWAKVRAAYDTPPTRLEERFCDELEGTYAQEPWTERFPHADWMQWSTEGT